MTKLIPSGNKGSGKSDDVFYDKRDFVPIGTKLGEKDDPMTVVDIFLNPNSQPCYSVFGTGEKTGKLWLTKTDTKTDVCEETAAIEEDTIMYVMRDQLRADWGPIVLPELVELNHED